MVKEIEKGGVFIGWLTCPSISNENRGSHMNAQFFVKFNKRVWKRRSYARFGEHLLLLCNKFINSIIREHKYKIQFVI